MDFAIPSQPSSQEDRKAVYRYLEITGAMFMDPIYGENGDYPDDVRKEVDRKSKEEGRNTSRLPYFTTKEKNDLKGSSDFFGLNHYETAIVECKQPEETPSFESDSEAVSTGRVPIPKGFRAVLNWVKNKYGNPPVFITENGKCINGSSETNDPVRVKFYHDYIREMLKAIYIDKCNVIGYVAWSIIDTFEFNSGYSVNFGLYHVDFEDPKRPRTKKLSANFFQQLLKTRKVPSIPFSSES